MRCLVSLALLGLIAFGCATTNTSTPEVNDTNWRALTAAENTQLDQRQATSRARYHAAFESSNVWLVEIPEQYHNWWNITLVMYSTTEQTTLNHHCEFNNSLSGCAVLVPPGYEAIYIVVSPSAGERRYAGTIRVRHGSEPAVEWHVNSQEGPRRTIMTPSATN